MLIGVPHAEELYYLFGSPFIKSTPCPEPNNTVCPSTWENYQPWSQSDLEVSKETMAVWVAFAKQRLVNDDDDDDDDDDDLTRHLSSIQ